MTAFAFAHAAATEHLVPLFPAAADPLRQGFVRIINHSGRPGEVRIRATDDEGVRFSPTTLSIGANQTVHFNSTDLEHGNAAKGMPGGIGSGAGDWWLTASSGLDIEVLSYLRTPADGFLTSMHDLAPVDENGRHRVAVFNPAANLDQQSRLRIVNAGEQVANLTITGIDGRGESPGSQVRLSIPPGAVETLDAKELESGSPKFQDALGDGAGKWQLVVESDQPIFVMSLLLSPTSHLTNLSTAPVNADEGAHTVPMFPAASDPLERQGFVRVINHAAESGEVFINAFDDTNRDYPRLTLSLDSDETVHINSDDLEMGNAAKGLVGGTGAGEGDWRLEFSSGLDIEVLAYIRTKRDGFLTSMHDRVPREGKRHRVPVFNPAANVNQASRLRLINAGENTAEVEITGLDGRGARSTGRVSVSVPAGTSRTLTAQELEAGGDGFEGELGAGAGKWQLVVESEQPIIVMSLLASPTGHLTNLSTAPAVDFAPTDAAVFDDRFVGGRVVKDVPANYVDFLAGGRFRKTEGAEIDSGDHTYTRIEPNKATIVLDYDDGDRCTYEFRFRSRTAGDLSYDCADDSGESGWHLAETPSADDNGDAHCRPNDIIDPGESCDLYGTDFTFDVESSGRSCLRAGGFISCSGNRQNLSDSTINGVRITLVAARNQDNSWTIENVDPIPPDSAVSGTDLVVSSASASDSRPAPGASFKLTAVVRNSGTDTSAATTLRYYRSSNPTVSTGDAVVGSDAVGELQATHESEQSINLAAPADPGIYYYGACVDAVSGETDVANNCSTAVMVTVGGDGSGAPDLVVESPSVSDAEPDAGASFALSVVVRNQGDGGSSSTMLRYYRSNDAGISRTDTEVGAQAVAELAAAARLDRSTTVTAPDAGTFYYGACVDSVRGETDVANNCSTAVMVTVGGGGSAAPDLVVESPSVSDAEPDAGASFALSVVVRNQGDGGSSATFLRYYRSNDAGISRTDTEVGLRVVAELAAAASLDRSTTVTALNAGTVYYGACVDAVAAESDTGNNCSSGVRVSVAEGSTTGGGNFDLARDNWAPTGIAYANGRFYVVDWHDDKVYAYATNGQRDDAADFDLNNAFGHRPLGIAHANGRFYVVHRRDKVYAYATNGQRDDAADFDLAGDNSSPAGIAHAYGRFYVVDSTDDKVYAYWANGQRDAAADFDLDGDNGSPTGIAHADGRFYVVDVTNDKVYAYATNGERDAAADFDLDGDNRAPFGIAHANGWFYVVDSTDHKVYAYNPAGPDLVVASPSVSDATPDIGAVFQLRATVSNRGKSRSTATTLRYYRSDDDTISVADSEVGSEAVGALDAAGAREFSIEVTAPSVVGTYYYGACADSVAGEPAGQNNNCSPGVRVRVGAEGFGFDLAGDNSDAAGIVHANGRLYVSDYIDDKVYAYATNGQRDAAADFDLAGDNSSPAGIAHAYGRFYVVDSTDDKVYAYATNGQRDAAADFDLAGDNSSPAGIAHAYGRFYVVDSTDDKVYAYATNGQRDAAADFDLAGDNGIAHANGRFYVVDSTADKVYAYWANGQRDAAADFDLTGGNRNPTGIAHANGMLYVLDSSGEGVYEYSPAPDSDGPDLVVQSPSTSEGAPEAGESFTFSTTVRNRGNRQSPAATLRYFRSTDAAISPDDTELGSDSLGGLSASASRNRSVSLTAPDQEGCYFCGACVDTVEGESSTANNCSRAVEILVGERPDLDVTRAVLHYPLSGYIGQSISMTVDVTNEGAGISRPAKLRFSNGTEVEIPSLAPNETMTVERHTVGSVWPGTSRYTACIADVPCEQETTNNCASRSVTYR